MFTITVQYHMEDKQCFHTSDPAVILASLDMAHVLHLDVDRDMV